LEYKYEKLLSNKTLLSVKNNVKRDDTNDCKRFVNV